MTRTAFYVDELDGSQQEAVFQGPLAHQFRHVLRLAPGARVELRNGRGQAWWAEIVGSDKRSVRVRLLEPLVRRQESPLALTLALPYARSDRMDLVVRQAVELGIWSFLAFPAQRSQYDLQGAGEPKRRERWRRIAREAMCQCGRSVLPEIRLVAGLDAFLQVLEQERKPDALKVLALETGRARDLLDLHREWPQPPEIIALVGCEGGWTEPEAERLCAGGFQPVHLGPRILRLETAVISLLGCIQLLWGDGRGPMQREPAPRAGAGREAP